MPNGTASGADLVSLGQKHVGEKYVLGVLVPKNNSGWKGPWDCSEFASWLVYQVAGELYGCESDSGNPATSDAFTGYWGRDARGLGEIVSLDVAAGTAGACVLRLAQPGTTGHIVISDGRGGTVEAHSHLDGVINSTLNGRRWDLGILVRGIAYDRRTGPPVTPPPTEIYRLTTPQMTGAVVENIQNALKDKGFDPGGIDGRFGPQTQAAVVAFQLSAGLVADGEVGPLTAAALGIAL
jgi:N-acetylmuramoyl-L-alanine amidase